MLPADDLTAACCAETIARVLASSSADECPTCGTVYLPPDNDDARPSCVAPAVPLPRLADVITDVALALRWRREEREGLGRAPDSVLARLQGQSSGASSDATATTTAALWRLITQPSSKVGRRARSGFVDVLLRHCEETSRPLEDEPDWAAARALAAVYGTLDAASRDVLRVLAARCDPAVGWDAACLVVADACAPAALRATWTGVYRTLDTAGRPRVDRLAPPPEAAPRVWGEERLRAALVAWAAARA